MKKILLFAIIIISYSNSFFAQGNLDAFSKYFATDEILTKACNDGLKSNGAWLSPSQTPYYFLQSHFMNKKTDVFLQWDGENFKVVTLGRTPTVEQQHKFVQKNEYLWASDIVQKQHYVDGSRQYLIVIDGIILLGNYNTSSYNHFRHEAAFIGCFDKPRAIWEADAENLSQFENKYWTKAVEKFKATTRKDAQLFSSIKDIVIDELTLTRPELFETVDKILAEEFDAKNKIFTDDRSKQIKEETEKQNAIDEAKREALIAEFGPPSDFETELAKWNAEGLPNITAMRVYSGFMKNWYPQIKTWDGTTSGGDVDYGEFNFIGNGPKVEVALKQNEDKGYNELICKKPWSVDGWTTVTNLDKFQKSYFYEYKGYDQTKIKEEPIHPWLWVEGNLIELISGATWNNTLNYYIIYSYPGAKQLNTTDSLLFLRLKQYMLLVVNDTQRKVGLK
jgi:hypothetical protein